MSIYSQGVEEVVNGKGAIRQTIVVHSSALDAIRGTSACAQCAEYVAQHSKVPAEISLEEMLNRGARLLFALAALQAKNPHVQREQLCLMGPRGVGTYENSRRERVRKAALERERPLRDQAWYVEHHLPRVIDALAGNLEALTERPELLAEALRADGQLALVRHV